MVTNAKEIIQAAKLDLVLNHYDFQLRKHGSASHITKCPKCSADGKTKGLKIAKSLEVGTCYQCDTIFTPITVIAVLERLDEKSDYIKILEKLSKLTLIDLQYEKKTPTRKIKKNTAASSKTESIETTHTLPDYALRATNASQRAEHLKSFRDSQLEQSGITHEAQQAWYISKSDKKRTQASLFVSGSKDEKGDRATGDDMIILKIDLDRNLRVYYKPKGKNTGEFYTTPKDDFRVRFKFPEHNLDKYGKPMKYWSGYGSSSSPFHPEPVLHAFENSLPVHTYFIDEGEKKATKRSMHGMVASGIMGINNMANDGRLHPDFSRFVKRCNVKNVVFTLDADWDDLPSSNDKNIDGRAYSFFYAVKYFRDYFYAMSNEGLDLNLFIAYINKKQVDNDLFATYEKGVDDLLAGSLKGKEQELKLDYEKAMKDQPKGVGQHVTCINITTFSEQKILNLFHLGTREEFVEHHRASLLARRSEEEIANQQPVKFLFGKTWWFLSVDGEIELAQPLDPAEIFWAKNGNRARTAFRILHTKKNVFMRNRHIGLMKTSRKGESYAFKHIRAFPQTKIVEEYTYEQLRHFVYAYLLEINEIEIYEFLVDNDSAFTDKTLNKLPFIDDSINFLKPSAFSQYLSFQNGFWFISETGIFPRSIGDSEGYVWPDQIIERSPSFDNTPLLNIDRDPNQPEDWNVEFTERGLNAHFLQFLWNTGDFNWDMAAKLKRERDHENCTPERKAEIEAKLQRFKTEQSNHLINKMTAFGYLLHSYYNSAVTKVVIFIDGKNSEIGSSFGRSGKSICVDALEHGVKLVRLDGKKANLTEDPFAFADVTPTTRVVCYDDTEPKFNFTRLFSIMMGNFKVRGLYMKETTIAKENTPKFLVTTNHTIEGDSDSFTDRQHFCVFSDYYNARHKPIDDFKIRFFDDWEETNDQWNSYDYFLATCLHLYFKHGLVTVTGDQVKKRSQRVKIGEPFIKWMDNYFFNYAWSEENEQGHIKIPFGEKLSRPDMQEAFWQEPTNKKFVTANRFKEKVILWCEYQEFDFNKGVPTKDVKTGQITSPDGGYIKTNGIEYFVITPRLGSINQISPEPSIQFPNNDQPIDDLPF